MSTAHFSPQRSDNGTEPTPPNIALEDNVLDQPPSNLRRSQRTTRPNFRVRFADDMSAAGSSKSYRPHHQFLHQGMSEYKADNSDTKTLERYITGIIMTQMTAKAGIQKHGQLAVDALLKEFKQLHDKSVFEGIDPTTLSRQQKREAL